VDQFKVTFQDLQGNFVKSREKTVGINGLRLNRSETPNSVDKVEFLDPLSSYQILKVDPAP
jgi:hypothetical protein